MARKSKRMALYEAIRQGQVNIAKGLESGQMRSDGLVCKREKTGFPDSNALFKKQEKSPVISALPKILAAVSGLAVLIVLLFVVWLVMHFAGGSETVAPIAGPEDRQAQEMVTKDTPDQVERTEKIEEKDSGFFGFGAKKESEEKEQAGPVPSQGSNVIVIQQVHPDQQDKLLPVQAFFNAKGVATEMIQRGGYTLLVTKAGFDYNPYRQGTEGYRLFQQIRQFGLAYPEASGDTKFGLKPFQDAYPLNKDK